VTEKRERKEGRKERKKLINVIHGSVLVTISGKLIQRKHLIPSLLRMYQLYYLSVTFNLREELVLSRHLVLRHLFVS
jgi:hypothetical protein